MFANRSGIITHTHTCEAAAQCCTVLIAHSGIGKKLSYSPKRGPWCALRWCTAALPRGTTSPCCLMLHRAALLHCTMLHRINALHCGTHGMHDVVTP